MSSVEERLADALAARANLEQADDHLLRRRHEEIATAATDSVISLDSAVDHDDALAGAASLDAARARRRRLVRVLAAAAAVIALVAAAVGVARLSARHTLQPAAGSLQQAYAGLARPQQPSDLAGSPFGDAEEGGDGVQRSSVRLLGQLPGRTYYAALDAGGRLCWIIEHDSGSSGGCELKNGPAETFELSETGSAVEAWLVADGSDTSGLTRRGFTEVAPSLWLPRDAVGPVTDLFSVLRSPWEPSDAFPAFIDGSRYTAGSERVLTKTGEATYWAATNPAGEVCFMVLLNQAQAAGSTCQPPLVAATRDSPLKSTAGSASVEAYLVPDHYSTAGWEQEGRVPLAPSLWVDRATGEQAAVEQLTAAAPFTVAPTVAMGTQEIRIPAGAGLTQVLVRCLTASPLQVRLNGVVRGGTLCVDRPRTDELEPVDVPLVNDSPVTVTISGPEEATWAAGVVKRTPAG
ncbi:hypothetical protein SAMN06264364_14013 [Quadrisphaera granulorum]|uniref:Uncharacterized protein n=1 Tax=Quadrisphaera granulorum TaxID=317664 RepID=A0A315ZPI8_9ACTN|nr:hypothetical protein [Quadrisphaera granulorum]PWJ47199.1 hypothetical protein BXY45_14013 [Quadrisphaera granulorum]SZE98885.1 hypothetical protein SAMN06264364_14013 [Quadrisphaera granulorum]